MVLLVAGHAKAAHAVHGRPARESVHMRATEGRARARVRFEAICDVEVLDVSRACDYAHPERISSELRNP